MEKLENTTLDCVGNAYIEIVAHLHTLVFRITVHRRRAALCVRMTWWEWQSDLEVHGLRRDVVGVVFRMARVSEDFTLVEPSQLGIVTAVN